MLCFFRPLPAAILFSICLASDKLEPKIEPNGTSLLESEVNSSDKISIRYEIPIVYPGTRAENISKEFIHRRLSSDDVKKDLDEFILKRDRVFIPVYIPIPNSVIERVGNDSNIDLDRVNLQPYHYLNESDVTSTVITTTERPYTHAWKIPKTARKLFLKKENEPAESDLDVENLKLNYRENLSSIGLGFIKNGIPNHVPRTTDVSDFKAMENVIAVNIPNETTKEDSNAADISIKDIFDGTRRLKHGSTNGNHSAPNKAQVNTHTKFTNINSTHIEKPEKAIGEHKTKILKIPNREDQIINILRKQTELLEQVAKVLEENEAARTKKANPDFDNLLLELENKKKEISAGNNMTQAAMESVKKKIELAKEVKYNKVPAKMKLTTKLKNKEKLTTMETIIDETEVRKAIRDNPYVQRIMKMAKRKRDQYFRDAKEYYNL